MLRSVSALVLLVHPFKYMKKHCLFFLSVWQYKLGPHVFLLNKTVSFHPFKVTYNPKIKISFTTFIQKSAFKTLCMVTHKTIKLHQQFQHFHVAYMCPLCPITITETPSSTTILKCVF